MKKITAQRSILVTGLAAVVLGTSVLTGCGAVGGSAGSDGSSNADNSATEDVAGESGSSVDADSSDREVVNQVSLLQGLTFGDYYGSVPVRKLKELGDIGIGTFDSLNGELIMLDGVVYRAAFDGSVEEVSDDELIPFCDITFFDEDESVDASGIGSIEELKNFLNDKVLELGSNQFYMVRIDGSFSEMHVRSEYSQEEPYEPLAKVLETDQTFFDYEDIEGTVVGLYCPEYMEQLNAVGWHFHFISDDREKGGHVLDLSIASADAGIDKTGSFSMVLPDSDLFNYFDLTTDQSEDIKRVETGDGDADESVESDADNETENETEDESSSSFGAEAGLYDRTYLEERDGIYIYNLTDDAIIKKYDELYADAFKDTIDSYEEVMSWQNQRFEPDKDITANNLVYNNASDGEMIRTGSTFEMDFDFDLNNVGYTYVDLDSDGNFELIFGVLQNDDQSSLADFERSYALVDNSVVKTYEGGSRYLFWLGSDGHIYNTGSGGAAYSGTSKMHFDPSEVSVSDPLSWGDAGFVQDEYIGYWEVPVHFKVDPDTDMDAAAQLPENQISEEELESLSDEWFSKQVGIEWLKMSDYMDRRK